MNAKQYEFDLEHAYRYLLRYYDYGDERDFSMFVRHGVRQFIVRVVGKKFRDFKKEVAEDMEQEVANVVLLRLMKPRKVPIINMKSYLYTAALNASRDVIKKYKLYENAQLLSFEDRAYQIESPNYVLNQVEVMETGYAKLLHYFTRRMKPERMRPCQAYVFIAAIQGYTCREIAETMPERKFETVKSDLRDARRIFRKNGISRARILKVLDEDVVYFGGI